MESTPRGPQHDHAIEERAARTEPETIAEELERFGRSFPPGAEEEQVIEARLTMAVNDEGNICAIQKGLAGYFTPQQLIEASKLAREKALELRKKLKW